MAIFSFAFIFKLTFFKLQFWLNFYAVLIFWRSDLVLYYFCFNFTTISCTFTQCRTLNFNTSLFFGYDPPIFVFLYYMYLPSLCFCMPIRLSVWMSVRLTVRLFVHSTVCTSLCLSVSFSLNCINALKQIVLF